MTNPTPLSPAAQAVLDAFGKYPLHHDNPSHGLLHGALPAALRAAADQVVPLCSTKSDRGMQRMMIRNDFLAIADELEAQ